MPFLITIVDYFLQSIFNCFLIWKYFWKLCGGLIRKVLGQLNVIFPKKHFSKIPIWSNQFLFRAMPFRIFLFKIFVGNSPIPNDHDVIIPRNMCNLLDFWTLLVQQHQIGLWTELYPYSSSVLGLVPHNLPDHFRFSDSCVKNSF